MKSFAQFERFYDDELKLQIRDIDSEGEKIKQKYSFKAYGVHMAILAGSIVLFALVIANSRSKPFWIIGFLLFATVLYGIIKPIYIFMKRNLIFDQFNVKYKTCVVPKIVGFIDPELQYNSGGTIAATKFDVRTFYARTNSSSKCTSTDLVSGKLDGHDFTMADVGGFIQSLDGVGSREDRIYFTGTYAAVSLKNSFKGKTYLTCRNKLIQPLNNAIEGIEGFQSQIADLLGSVTGKDREVFNRRLPEGFEEYNTDDEDFNKVYDIITTENSDAPSFLSSHFLKSLLKIYQDFGKDFSLAIKDNELHVFFDAQDQFETDVHVDSLDSKNKFSAHSNFRIFETISKLVGLIEN